MKDFVYDTENHSITETSPDEFNEILFAKDHRIAVLERALKLACEELRMPYRNDGKTKIITYTKDTQIIENLPDYFIDQAEKELKHDKD